MLVQLRRISAVVAVVLVGLGLVVLDPNGPKAFAWQTPPPITWNPSAIGTDTNTWTPDQWNKALSSNPDKVYAPPTSTGPAAGKPGVGTALGTGTALLGYGIGVEAGKGITSAIGLPTTGSVWCDWATAFGLDGCSMGAAPNYVPNSDVTPIPEGWGYGNEAWGKSTNCGSIYCNDVAGWSHIRFSVTGPPAGQAGTVVVEAQAISLPPNANTSEFYVGVAPMNRLNGGGTSGTATARWDTQPVYRHATTLTAQQNSRGFIVVVGYYGGNVLVPILNGTLVPPAPLPENSPGVTAYAGVGVTWRPAGVEDNPQRWWRTTWQCSTGTPGGSQQSAPFREADPEWPAFPTAQCDPSAVTTSILVEQLTANGATTKVFEWTAPDGFREWAASDCVGGGCDLLLHRIDAVTGSRLSCFTNSALCTQWAADPNREQNYECTYGGTVVALDECLVYAPTFDPSSPANYAAPDGSVATTPAPGTDPTGPGKDESCPPPFTWTSLVNPWWYYKSTVCALQEVFVPTNTAAQVQRIKNAIDATTPAVWAGEVSGMFDQVPAAGGCQGPELHLTMFGLDKRTYPFSACEAPMSTAAPWVRGVATVLLVVFGSMAAVRALGSGFGWKPSAGGDS